MRKRQAPVTHYEEKLLAELDSKERLIQELRDSIALLYTDPAPQGLCRYCGATSSFRCRFHQHVQLFYLECPKCRGPHQMPVVGTPYTF